MHWGFENREVFSLGSYKKNVSFCVVDGLSGDKKKNDMN